MAKAPPTTEPHIERPGPAEFRDPIVRREMQKAAVWFGMALAIAGVIVLGQPLLLIVGGAIFAVFLDGGARLLGRYLPIRRGWRLGLVLLLGFGFLGWVIWFAGTTIGAQFEALRQVVTAQFDRVVTFAGTLGLGPKGQSIDIGSQLLGGVGRTVGGEEIRAVGGDPLLRRRLGARGRGRGERCRRGRSGRSRSRGRLDGGGRGGLGEHDQQAQGRQLPKVLRRRM